MPLTAEQNPIAADLVVTLSRHPGTTLASGRVVGNAGSFSTAPARSKILGSVYTFIVKPEAHVSWRPDSFPIAMFVRFRPFYPRFFGRDLPAPCHYSANFATVFWPLKTTNCPFSDRNCPSRSR